MKIWKLWTAGVSLVLFIGLVALCGAVWNNLSTEWAVEQTTAQYALDHSPINHIERHQQFTADGLEEVYYGTDAFNKAYFVFVLNNPYVTKSVPASGLISEADVTKRVASLKVTVNHVTIGYIGGKTSANGEGKASVVYEVYGENQRGKHVYYYYDANSGSLLWKYMLST